MTVSNVRLNNDGRRPIESSRSELGKTELVNVCERCARRGSARGPPGTVGGLEMRIGREIFAVDGGFFAASLPEDDDMVPDDDDKGVGGNLSFREERLAFRPRDAKKPAPFIEGDETRERTDEGGVPLVALELERLGCVLRGGLTARDGYGKAGGTPGGVMSL